MAGEPNNADDFPEDDDGGGESTVSMTSPTVDPSMPVMIDAGVDAGVGDLVLTCAGSSARQTNITKDTPVDAVIMAVIDSLEVDGKVVFRKS